MDNNEELEKISFDKIFEIGYNFSKAKMNDIIEALKIPIISDRPVFLIYNEVRPYLLFHVPLGIIDGQILFQRIWEWKNKDDYIWGTDNLDKDIYCSDDKCDGTKFKVSPDMLVAMDITLGDGEGDDAPCGSIIKPDSLLSEDIVIMSEDIYNRTFVYIGDPASLEYPYTELSNELLWNFYNFNNNDEELVFDLERLIKEKQVFYDIFYKEWFNKWNYTNTMDKKLIGWNWSIKNDTINALLFTLFISTDSIIEKIKTKTINADTYEFCNVISTPQEASDINISMKLNVTRKKKDEKFISLVNKKANKKLRLKIRKSIINDYKNLMSYNLTPSKTITNIKKCVPLSYKNDSGLEYFCQDFYGILSKLYDLPRLSIVENKCFGFINSNKEDIDVWSNKKTIHNEKYLTVPLINGANNLQKCVDKFITGYKTEYTAIGFEESKHSDKIIKETDGINFYGYGNTISVVPVLVIYLDRFNTKSYYSSNNEIHNISEIITDDVRPNKLLNVNEIVYELVGIVSKYGEIHQGYAKDQNRKIWFNYENRPYKNKEVTELSWKELITLPQVLKGGYFFIYSNVDDDDTTIEVSPDCDILFDDFKKSGEIDLILTEGRKNKKKEDIDLEVLDQTEHILTESKNNFLQFLELLDSSDDDSSDDSSDEDSSSEDSVWEDYDPTAFE